MKLFKPKGTKITITRKSSPRPMTGKTLTITRKSKITPKSKIHGKYYA